MTTSGPALLVVELVGSAAAVGVAVGAALGLVASAVAPAEPLEAGGGPPYFAASTSGGGPPYFVTVPPGLQAVAETDNKPVAATQRAAPPDSRVASRLFLGPSLNAMMVIFREWIRATSPDRLSLPRPPRRGELRASRATLRLRNARGNNVGFRCAR